MLRMDDTEDEVDLRPLKPAGPVDSLYDERGVTGAGDMDERCLGVGTLGRTWVTV